MTWFAALLRIIAAWLERLNLTQWKRDAAERRKRLDEANKRADEMAAALARGDLAAVERLQRMRDRAAGSGTAGSSSR